MTAFGDIRVVPADHPLMAGNWHPFPPPEPGFYNLRRVVRSTGDEVPHKPTLRPEETRTIAVYQGAFQFEVYLNKRVHLTGKNGRYMVMGRRVSKLTAQDGWQFQFLPSRFNFRPFVQLYSLDEQGQLKPERRVEVTGQLPLARSIEEARYLVRFIPDRYPAFWHQHVEFIEEQLQ